MSEHEFDAPDDVPPDADSDEFHDPDEAFVTRDAEDNIAPVTKVAGTLGTALIRPMVYGDVEAYFGDAGEVEQAGPEVVAEVIRNHVVKPDYEAYARENYRQKVDADARGSGGPSHYLTGAVVRDEMLPMVPQQLLSAIMDASGIDADVDVDDGGTATIDFSDEGN
jgi:hypothetical protein